MGGTFGRRLWDDALMPNTYYQWLAESIVLTDHTMVKDILTAINHALKVPGDVTPAQADRLGKLEAEIRKLIGDRA